MVPPQSSSGGDAGRLTDEFRRDFAAAIERTLSVALGLAITILRDRNLAEDATQEAAANILAHQRQFDPTRGSLDAWYLTAVRNRAIDELRQRSQRAARVRDAEHVAQLDKPVAFARAAKTCPETCAVVSDDTRLIRAALNDLPYNQRQVVFLACFAGLTQTEIAAETSAPLGTVKGRMRLALSTLSNALGRQEADEQSTR